VATIGNEMLEFGQLKVTTAFRQVNFTKELKVTIDLSKVQL